MSSNDSYEIARHTMVQVVEHVLKGLSSRITIGGTEGQFRMCFLHGSADQLIS